MVLASSLPHQPPPPESPPVVMSDVTLTVPSLRFSIDSLLETPCRKRPAPETASDGGKRAKIERPMGASRKSEAVIHPALQKVQLRLEGAELWRKFHALGTEMIVTKSGRRMFPTLQFSVTGLCEDVSYSFMVDFACMDHKRYRYSFHQSKWVVAGPGEVELPSRSHLHCDSPAFGSHWTKNFISFDKIKLTNNQLDQNGHVATKRDLSKKNLNLITQNLRDAEMRHTAKVIVNSMHRYMPRVHVVVNRNGSGTEIAGTRTFTFRETSFMAVTAYQNHRITELKIESNPFAKGFRECELDDLSTLATSSQFGLPYSALYPLFFPLLFTQPHP